MNTSRKILPKEPAMSSETGKEEYILWPHSAKEKKVFSPQFEDRNHVSFTFVSSVTGKVQLTLEQQQV